MVPILMFIGLLLLMVCLLMAPTQVNAFMQMRVPREARSSAANYPQFAAIMIFFLGIGLFYELGRTWPTRHLQSLDPIQKYMDLIGVVFFLIVGICSCIWPISAMRIFVQQLRKVPESALDPHARNVIVVVSKAFGVASLLAASLLVHTLASR